MIHEYALEPEVLTSPENIRYFLEQFGVHKGRMIADFPKRWTSHVYRISLSKLKPVERKRFGVLLESLSDKVLERQNTRQYPDNDWLENAELIQQENREPFRAIVATTNPRAHASVLLAADVTEDTPLWKVPRQLKVERKARALARIAERLIQISKNILLIEPYFDPCNPTFTSSLKAFLHPLKQKRGGIGRLELHCCIHSTSSKNFWRNCAEELPKCIPSNIELSVFRWKVKDYGERFHRRYVLTERGGIAFEGGLDRGKEGQTTDVYLLEPELMSERWNDYQLATSTFETDPEGPLVIRGR